MKLTKIFFIENLGIRELVSIVDTYADFGDDLEVSISLGITNFLYHEKLFLTTPIVYNLEKKEKLKKEKLNFLAPSFHSFRLAYDDSFLVFLTRLSKVYSKKESLNSIWVKILSDLLKMEGSSLKMVFDNLSEDLKEDYKTPIDFYLKNGYFSEEILKKIEDIKGRSYAFGR